MNHTDKKPETEGRRLGEQVADACGIQRDTVTWLWPRKPMSGKATGSAPKGGPAGGKGSKSQSKPSKTAGRARSGKGGKKVFPGWM